jgi:2-oxoglutarate ferredoxin oxidoreductase subunit beta
MSELEIEKKMLGVIEKSREWGDHIPIGVFYQDETVPTYSDRLRERIPSYLSDLPCKQAVMRENNRSILDLQKIFFSQELLY